MTAEMLRNQMLFLGNHDLPRCLTLTGNGPEKVKAAWRLVQGKHYMLWEVS